MEKDSNFEGIAPSLFGPEFTCKSKDHVEKVKALRYSGAKESKQQFFQQSPPTTGGTTENQEEQAPNTFRKVTINSRIYKGLNGPNECNNLEEENSHNSVIIKSKCEHIDKRGDHMSAHKIHYTHTQSIIYPITHLPLYTRAWVTFTMIVSVCIKFS